MLPGNLAAASGVILFIIGIVALLPGIGCFKAWSWVWIVGVIVAVIALLMNIVVLSLGGMGGILAIIIDAIILWYFFQPQVKAYFGVS
ncbi:MAG: hypothetical protein MUE45_03835 [Methanoregulaceae archaeon]|nr:hypothetical protein [Methanoregulaceae archaeon]MCU0628606.1 hypothetical protein [Methanoregulaceae archaeon]